MLLLTLVQANALGAGLELPDVFEISMITPGSVPSDIVGRTLEYFDLQNTSGVGATKGKVQICGSPCLMIPPNVDVRLTNYFTGAAALKSSWWNLHGLLVPHGTFSE